MCHELKLLPIWPISVRVLIFGRTRINCGNWGESDVQVNFAVEVVRVDSGAEEHLSCTLRVTNVGEILLAGDIEDVIDEGRKILEPKLLLAEIPVLSFMRVKCSVELCVSSATIVWKPNIVALVGEDKGRCQIRIISRPKVHVAFTTVH